MPLRLGFPGELSERLSSIFSLLIRRSEFGMILRDLVGGRFVRKLLLPSAVYALLSFTITRTQLETEHRRTCKHLKAAMTSWSQVSRS